MNVNFKRNTLKTGKMRLNLSPRESLVMMCLISFVVTHQIQYVKQKTIIVLRNFIPPWILQIMKYLYIKLFTKYLRNWDNVLIKNRKENIIRGTSTK